MEPKDGPQAVQDVEKTDVGGDTDYMAAEDFALSDHVDPGTIGVPLVHVAAPMGQLCQPCHTLACLERSANTVCPYHEDAWGGMGDPKEGGPRCGHCYDCAYVEQLTEYWRVRLAGARSRGTVDPPILAGPRAGHSRGGVVRIAARVHRRPRCGEDGK